MRPRSVVALSLLAGALVVACDDRQAFHRPDPGLERMQIQPKVVPYAAAMRVPPPGTVRRGAELDPMRRDGMAGGVYADEVPLPVTRALVTSGRAAFERVCATCHGILGDGRSVVADKMALRPPPSLHDARVTALAPGQIYAAITRGYGLMPSFASMLTDDERWSVVAYVRALQRSRAVPVATLPPDVQRTLAAEAP